MQKGYINREEAFRYMGHKGGVIPDHILELADQCEQQLLQVMEPRYTYKVFDLSAGDTGIRVGATPLYLEGKDIAAHLEHCTRCIFFCATLSAGVDRLIRTYETREMEKAVITDCMASSAVEQLCNDAEAEIEAQLGNAVHYTWRFSPGYGDFPLAVQRQFLDLLDASRKIGVTVTDRVIGISEKEIPQKRRGCSCCNMRKTCPYRKRGEHCGF